MIALLDLFQTKFICKEQSIKTIMIEDALTQKKFFYEQRTIKTASIQLLHIQQKNV